MLAVTAKSSGEADETDTVSGEGTVQTFGFRMGAECRCWGTLTMTKNCDYQQCVLFLDIEQADIAVERWWTTRAADETQLIGTYLSLFMSTHSHIHHYPAP